MATRQHRPGMTPAEVLVFAATCTLLGLVLIPTLARAGGGSTRATCLQNLQALGAATQMYAEQDSRELLMPLHAMQVVDIGPLGGLFNGTVWSYRTANWFTWGGATATEEFYVAPSSGPLLGQGDTGRYYGAQTRPLTRFLYPDITEDPDAGMYVTNLPAFRCPRDVGFPSITLAGGEQLIDDSPEANADRPCYDTLGTSYRPNLAGYFGGAYHFTYGPAGHKRSDLATPERVIFGGDAVWAVHTGEASNTSIPGTTPAGTARFFATTYSAATDQRASLISRTRSRSHPTPAYPSTVLSAALLTTGEHPGTSTPIQHRERGSSARAPTWDGSVEKPGRAAGRSRAFGTDFSQSRRRGRRHERRIDQPHIETPLPHGRSSMKRADHPSSLMSDCLGFRGAGLCTETARTEVRGSLCCAITSTHLPGIGALVVGVTILMSTPCLADPAPNWDVDSAKLFSPAAAIDQRVGKALAISGGRLLVGAPEDATNGVAAGAALLYAFDGAAWQFAATFYPSDPNEAQRFGTTVAIDGDVAVVGAPHDDEAHIDAGAAYIYRRGAGGWEFEAKLMAADAEYSDMFASALAVEGDVIVVGAPFVDLDFGSQYDPADVGAVYIYRFDGGRPGSKRPGSFSTTILRTTSTSPGLARRSRSTTDASSSALREHLPLLTYPGQLAYLVTYDGVAWSAPAPLPINDPDGQKTDMVGASVTISGDWIAIGAPERDRPAPHETADAGAVYTFHYSADTETWVAGEMIESPEVDAFGEPTTDDDHFGRAVALDGGNLLVGSRYDDEWGLNAGAAYRYHVDIDCHWSNVFKFEPAYFGQRDLFATAVALSDGHFAVGAPGDTAHGPLSGAAYVFDFLNDCNLNATPDEDDIASGVSEDINNNGIPDECEPPLAGDLKLRSSGQLRRHRPIRAGADRLRGGYAAAFPACDRQLADIDGDGEVTFCGY